MARDVFISYKSEEYHQAREVRLRLEAAGISCWMAPEDIPGGTSYAMEIPQAIRESKFFVLILSRGAMASRWVSRELDQAINAGKTILPMVLEACPLTPEFDFYLSNVQQYFAYRDKEAALQALIRDIRGEETTPLPKKKTEPVPTPAPQPVAAPVERPKKKGVLPAILLCVALVALVWILVANFSKKDVGLRITAPEQETQETIQTFQLDLENTRDQDILGLEMVLRFYDMDGKKICDTTVSSNGSLKAGVTDTMTITLHSSVVEKLYWYSWEELKVTVAITEVNFDGKVKDFGKGEEVTIKEADPDAQTKLEVVQDRLETVLEALDVVSVEDFEGLESVSRELDKCWDLVVQRKEMMEVVYQHAAGYMDKVQYEKAYFLFALLGTENYKDSADKAIECYDIVATLE